MADRSKESDGLCKITPDFDSGGLYYVERLDEDPESPLPGVSVYDTVNKLSNRRLMNGSSWLESEPQGYLEHIEKEVKARIRVTQHEIFSIGQLLTQAKKVCQQTDTKFKEWIAGTFDFSYETANNFMNVYKHCLGFREIALNISPSILYKLASPSFPEDLRKYLFETCDLDEMSPRRLKNIEMKFKEGGWEAIENDVEEITSAQLVINQVFTNFDLIRDGLTRLKVLKNKIEGGKTGARGAFIEDPFVEQEEKAAEINRVLHKAIRTAIVAMKTGESNAGIILDEFRDMVNKKHFSKPS